MDKKTFIVRDLASVQHMFENRNIMKGIKPLDEQDKPKDDKKEPKIFKLPAEQFADFEEIDDENEDMFEYVAFHTVIEYLERCCLCVPEDISEAATSEVRYANVKWDTALEFPSNLASMGRSKLHEVANFFGLAHHSRGGKKPPRSAVLYPKTLFIEKQETERGRLIREREKIRNKYLEKLENENEFCGGILKKVDEPQTFTEMCIKEIQDELSGKVKTGDLNEINTSYIKSNMLDPELIGKAPEPEKIESLIAEKKIDLERLLRNMSKKCERQNE